MRIRLAVFGLAFVVPALCTGCITDPVTGRSTLGFPISESEERTMGVQYRPTIVHQYAGPYPDRELQAHLERIVMGIARGSVRSDLDWEFTVLNSSVPNAFAVPGGQVFMTRGLIARLDDEAEFAVVMGHEIGHVEHRHTAQTMGRTALVGVAASTLGGKKYGDLLGAAGQLFVLPAVSREQERESDVRGVEHSYVAGYDPRQGADVFREFQKMKTEAGGGEGGISAWTSTHPMDSERIENVLALAAERDPRLRGDAPVPELRVTTPEWERLTERLRAEQKVYDRYDAAVERASQGGGESAIRAALPEFEAAARQLPGHAIFHNAVGKAYLALGDAARARQHLSQAASMRQSLMEPEYYLAELDLEQGRNDDAVDHATRALEILPGNYPSLYVRAEAFTAAGRTADAEADYRAVLESAPPESEQYRGATSRLGQPPAREPPREEPKRTRPGRRR